MKILYATDDQQITVNENGTVTVDPGQDEDIPAER